MSESTQNADAWQPDQYTKFRDERSQPFFELLAIVERRDGMRVVDLGCGTGELTRVLHDILGAAGTVGIDNSSAMLERAAASAGGGLGFEEGDIAGWSAPGQYDLVFSNAALQWVPGPMDVLSRATQALRPGGQLALQVPLNQDHPTHTVAAALADEPPYSGALDGHGRVHFVLRPEEYAEALYRLGYAEQRVVLRVYPHLLASREDVVEWVKGTLLTWYERRLGDLFPRFLGEYQERLFLVLPDERPFFYPFKRVLAWGKLPL